MRYFLILIFCAFSISTFAQPKEINTNPKAKLTLKISSSEGSNGSAVAWAPISEKYYTVIAGNEEFPITVFNESGTEIQTTTTQADVRGMWYNPFYELIEANVYEFHDIISYLIDETDGSITEDEPFEEIYELPVFEPNAVLALDTEDEQYIWFNSEEGKIFTIDAETGEEESDVEPEIPVDFANINYTTVIYTDIEDAEYGLLNYVDKKVYLFNKSNGKLTATIQLPNDAPTYNSLNFSCTNDYIWLFDKEKREWLGYPMKK